MMKCEIIRDLLPLYCDGLCSEASKQEIEAHVAQCEACHACLAEMKEEAPVPSLSGVGNGSPCSSGREEEVFPWAPAGGPDRRGGHADFFHCFGGCGRCSAAGILYGRSGNGRACGG